MSNMMNATLEKTIKHFGSRSAVARALGIWPQAVQQWRHVPTKHALKIEELSGGSIPAREILKDAQ